MALTDVFLAQVVVVLRAAMVATARYLRVVYLPAAAAAAELFFPVRTVRARPWAGKVALAAFAAAEVVRMLAMMLTMRPVQAAAAVVLVVLPTSSVGSLAPAGIVAAMVNSAAVAVVVQVMAEMADSAEVVALHGNVSTLIGVGRLAGMEALEGAVELHGATGVLLSSLAQAAISAAERTTTMAAGVERWAALYSAATPPLRCATVPSSTITYIGATGEEDPLLMALMRAARSSPWVSLWRSPTPHSAATEVPALEWPS